MENESKSAGLEAELDDEKKECGCMEQIKLIAKQIHDHRNDFASHRRESRIAMGQINTIHAQAQTFSESVKNLNALPGIHEVLQGIKDDLIVPATGKKHMPTSVAILVIVILGALLIFDRVRDSDKNLNLSPNGISITKTETTERTVEKKVDPASAAK